MNVKAIFLVAIVLGALSISFDSANAAAGTIETTINVNGWALSSIECWDSKSNNIYYEKQRTPACRHNNIKFTFNVPDSAKWDDIIVKFNHGISGQGPSDYVTIPAFTDGTAHVSFETYGDDVHADYKGVSNDWNDKHSNIFYLGQP